MPNRGLTVWVLCGAWLMSDASGSGGPDELGPQQALDACRALEDAERRLACYDRIPGAAVTGRDGLATAGTEAPADAPADESAPAAEPAIPLDRSRMMRHWELDDATHGGLLRVRRHEPVYLLPGRWSSDANELPSTPSQPEPARRPDLNDIEVKFQLSLKTKVADDLIGDNGDLWVGYTQQSNWQAFNSVESEPFRETNFMPEAFFTWRTGLDLLGWRWQMVNLGFVHQSNGRADPLSRSWNRIYAQFGFERNDFEFYARPWIRVEPSGDDDNPDIEEFLGHGDLKLVWRRGRHDVTLTTRFAPDENRGAIQADWHYPLTGDLKAYLQVFHGYGETLIDYNHRQTTIGLGVSLVQ